MGGSNGGHSGDNSGNDGDSSSVGSNDGNHGSGSGGDSGNNGCIGGGGSDSDDGSGISGKIPFLFLVKDTPAQVIKTRQNFILIQSFYSNYYLFFANQTLEMGNEWGLFTSILFINQRAVSSVFSSFHCFCYEQNNNV